MLINDKTKKYRISEYTEKKVRKIIKQHNFSPHQYARGFRLKRTKTIGLVVPDLINRYFGELSRNIEYVSRQNGYNVFIISSDDENIEKKVIGELLSRSVDGLIIASVTKEDGLIYKELLHNTPTVFIDRSIESATHSWVSSDNYKGAFDLVEYMCSK